jgi:hypothetical protein
MHIFLKWEHIKAKGFSFWESLKAIKANDFFAYSANENLRVVFFWKLLVRGNAKCSLALIYRRSIIRLRSYLTAAESDSLLLLDKLKAIIADDF